MAILKAAYPNFYKDTPTEELEIVVHLWTEMFEDYPLQVVMKAAKMVISECKFAPSISELLERVRTVQSQIREEEWRVRSMLRVMRDLGIQPDIEMLKYAGSLGIKIPETMQIAAVSSQEREAV
jgi:hypothetical protein